MVKFTGNIYWDGKEPKIKNRKGFIEWLSQFPEDQWFEFQATLVGSVNNTPQSKLYFTWCEILANEYGWDSKEEVHEYFKKAYNAGETTKSFSTEDWSQYMTKVLAFASSNGIKLPTGNESTG